MAGANAKLDELVREIAEKHNVAIGRDDPVLILHTMNQRLLAESAAAQQEILARFKSELEVIAHGWGADVKDKAERTLNAALTASKEAMVKGADEAAKSATNAIRKEVKEALDKIASGRRVATMNMIAALLTMMAAGVVLWTLLAAINGHLGAP